MKAVYGPTFLPFYEIIVSCFFLFSVKIQTKKDQKLCYNRLQSVKETQIDTI